MKKQIARNFPDRVEKMFDVIAEDHMSEYNRWTVWFQTMMQYKHGRENIETVNLMIHDERLFQDPPGVRRFELEVILRERTTSQG